MSAAGRRARVKRINGAVRLRRLLQNHRAEHAKLQRDLVRHVERTVALVNLLERVALSGPASPLTVDVMLAKAERRA